MYQPFKIEIEEREQDAADDVLDSVVAVYNDARALIERIQRLRSNGTLEVNGLSEFIGTLDDALADLLAADWNKNIDKAGIRLGGFPSLVPVTRVITNPQTAKDKGEPL